jgi:hypothetical protein
MHHTARHSTRYDYRPFCTSRYAVALTDSKS